MKTKTGKEKKRGSLVEVLYQSEKENKVDLEQKES